MMYAVVSLISLVGLASCEGTTGIGQGFYIPDLSIIEDNGFGKSIFAEIPHECIQDVHSAVHRQEKTYYEDSQAFYSSIGTESSLSGEVTTAGGFTLGGSLEAASKSIDSQKLDVKGTSLDVYAIEKYSQLTPDCITNLHLNENFQRDFVNLPKVIEDPSQLSHWYQYNLFLKTYGSHVTKRLSYGSKYTRYLFTKSSEKISQEEFSIKACASVDAAKVKLEACSQYSQEDYKRVSHFETSDTTTVRGGTIDSRAALMNEVTQELLEKFLKEAGNSDQAVSIQYESMWDFLKKRFHGTEHFRKAVNLEAYYLGYLNVGCEPQSESGYTLRRFRLVDDDPMVPVYHCELAPLGCRSDNDCHIGGAGSVCYCYGSSCVRAQSGETDPRHAGKKNQRGMQRSQSGSTWEGLNNSCKYHIGIYCVCRGGWGGGWETIWPLSATFSMGLSFARVSHDTLEEKCKGEGPTPEVCPPPECPEPRPCPLPECPPTKDCEKECEKDCEKCPPKPEECEPDCFFCDEFCGEHRGEGEYGYSGISDKKKNKKKGNKGRKGKKGKKGRKGQSPME